MKSFYTKFLAVVATGALSCGLMSQHAQAVPITGSIGFGGTGSASFSSGNQSGTGVTTTVTFGAMQVSNFPAPSGSYSGVSPGTPVAFQPFSFTGGGANNNNAVLLTPKTEWSFTSGGITYTFFFSSLNPASTGASPGGISLDGFGTLTATGFDTTTGRFAISGSGSGGSYSILFASNTAVPDGGAAVALLGIALIGIEGMRRVLAMRATA